MVKKQFWRVNEQIHAPKVRVIGGDGKQLGVISREQALEEARKVKQDLVEIAPNEKPPVARIIEFGKFKYQQEKKTRKSKVKAADLKEVRLSPFIAEADYATRLKRIREFITEGNKVKVVVKFRGREMQSREKGYDLTDRVLSEFENVINLDMKPKFLGRHLTMIISPLSSQKIKERKEKGHEEKTED